MSLNPKRSKKRRQHLRNNMTKAEVMLWTRLKGKKLLGYKVRRQYGVGNYVIDFYCPKIRLGIEIDGDTHFTEEGRKHDKTRSDYILDQNIELIRITNTDVYEDLDAVVRFLADEFRKRSACW